MQDADTNGDGLISPAEFKRMMQSKGVTDSQEVCKGYLCNHSFGSQHICVDVAAACLTCTALVHSDPAVGVVSVLHAPELSCVPRTVVRSW